MLFVFIGIESSVLFVGLLYISFISSSTVNKEKNLIDQRASLRVDTRETQQINWRRRHWADIGISRTGIRYIDGVTRSEVFSHL